MRVEPPFFNTSRNWDEEEDWNRDRWRSRNWWETTEQDQHWSWQEETWQQDGQEWDQHNSWQYEAWGQDSQDPTDPWQGWEGVAAWNERQAARSDSSRRPRSPAQEPASGSRVREDPPRKKGRAWWERPPPEYHWKDGEWKKKNTRGTRSLQKQAERIERGQKRRLENRRRQRPQHNHQRRRKAPRSPWTLGLHPLCCRSAGPAEPRRRRVGREHLGELEQQQLGGGAGATASPPGSEPAGGTHTLRKRVQTQRALLASEGPTPATAEQSGAGGTAKGGEA